MCPWEMLSEKFVFRKYLWIELINRVCIHSFVYRMCEKNSYGFAMWSVDIWSAAWFQEFFLEFVEQWQCNYWLSDCGNLCRNLCRTRLIQRGKIIKYHEISEGESIFPVSFVCHNFDLLWTIFVITSYIEINKCQKSSIKTRRVYTFLLDPFSLLHPFIHWSF